MEFRVVADSPDGTAHLMITDAPDTLCAEPADHFLPLDGVPADAGDVQWCWLCRLTAFT
jgi:hypothetical protein